MVKCDCGLEMTPHVVVVDGDSDVVWLCPSCDISCDIITEFYRWYMEGEEVFPKTTVITSGEFIKSYNGYEESKRLLHLIP